MSFYPDGQPHIPNQLPVPGSRPVPTAAETARARSRAFLRMAVINGVVLAVAVVVGIVLEVPSRETGIWVVVGAALLTAAHSVVVVMGMTRGQGHGRGAGPSASTDGVGAWPGTAVTDAPTAAITDAVITDAIVDDGVPGALFAFQIEDVFTITGRGTVVTGRVSRGEVRTGQRVTLLRDGRLLAHSQVAGIEASREQRTTASTGDLVGLLLAGVTRQDLERGDVVVA